MPVYGDLDPNYRFRQLDQVRQAGDQLMEFVAAQRSQKEKEKEEERRRNLERFALLVKASPEAAIGYGTKLADEMGGADGDFLRTYVETLKKQQEKGSPFRDALAAKEKEQQSWMTAGQIGSNVPQAPAVGAMMGQAMQARGAAMDPRVEAYQGLPFSQRIETQQAAQAEGWDQMLPQEPKVFDPLAHLPANVRAAYLGETGQLPPDTKQAGRVSAGLEEGASAKRGHDLQVSAQDFRDRDLKLRTRLADLSERKEKRIAEKQALDAKEGGPSKKDADKHWKAFGDDVQEFAALEAERAGSSVGAEQGTAEGSKTRSTLKISDFQATQASRWMRQAVDAGFLTQAEAEEMAQGLVAEYQQKVRGGMAPMKAWNETWKRVSDPEGYLQNGS